MHYVYLLQSKAFEGRRYIGATSDLKQRVADLGIW
jgi:predicted GIY-YIG superfamily endonuclease